MNRLILAASAAAALTGAAFAQESVRIGTEGAYPPWNFINDAGETAGYEVDLAAAICAEAGLTCEIVLNDWDSIIPNLLAGNYDVIMAGMSVTEERQQTIAFSDAYFPPDPSRYIAPPDTAFDFDAPSGARIGVQSSTIQSGYLEANLAGENTIVQFSTPDQALADLMAGNIDAILADANYLEPIVAATGGAVAFTGSEIMLGGGVAAGLRQGDDALLAAWNAALEALKANGTVDALIAQWFDGAGPFFTE